MEEDKFRELFSRKAIIGMIHLAGKDKEDRVKRALEELIQKLIFFTFREHKDF